MKIISITLMMMVFLMGLSLILDIIMEFNLAKALDDMISPLRVMEPIEWVIFLLYPLLVITLPIFSFYKKRKQKKHEVAPKR